MAEQLRWLAAVLHSYWDHHIRDQHNGITCRGAQRCYERMTRSVHD